MCKRQRIVHATMKGQKSSIRSGLTRGDELSTINSVGNERRDNYIIDNGKNSNYAPQFSTHCTPVTTRRNVIVSSIYIYILYYPLIVVSFIVIFAAFCTRLLDVAISLTGIVFVVAFLCGSQPASTTLCRFRCLVSLTKSGNKGLLPASRQGILKKTN